MSDRPVIFLDIDGVLNDHAWCHLGQRTPRLSRSCLDVLQVIIDRTQPHVVISSTWARHIEDGDVRAAGFAWMLQTHGVAVNVIDGINGRFRSDVPEQRWQERVAGIRRWLSISEHSQPWLVIDDLPLPLPAAHHVQTDPGRGLQPRHVPVVMEKLAAQRDARP